MRATTTEIKQEASPIEPRKLKIGEVSKLSGVGIEALRFYEKSGLLDRPAAEGGSAGIGGGGSAGFDVTLDVIFVAVRASIRATLDGARHRSALFSTQYDVDRKRYHFRAVTHWHRRG